MSKHTGGPWEYMGSSIVGPKLDDKETWLRPVVARFETGVSLANLNLMLAAPELLNALWAMVTSFHAVEYMEDHMKQAAEMGRAAIRKATGGPA